MMGSHSSLEDGIPGPFGDIFPSLIDPNAFFIAARSFAVRWGSAGAGLYAANTGVVHCDDNVGYDKRGPDIDTTEPSRLPPSDFCRQYLIANSRATEPP